MPGAIQRGWTRWPRFEQDELMAAQRVLESGRVNYWTGEEGRAFEAEYAVYLGSRHAIALSNGTVALELAFKALDVGPGDDVIVPARTFIATASAVVAVGARPVVADVDRDSGNITAETVAAAWTPDTKVVVVVHLAGWPAEVDDLQAVCAERGAHLVEDCAQAHGATYRGRQVGTFGRISTFSFCQDKIMTTAGEGGLVVTNDDDLARSMVMYKDHGTDPVLMAGAAESPAYKWIHADFGSNARMTEVQSAIGRRQLKKLPSWAAARARNADYLMDRFRHIAGLRVPNPPAYVGPAWYKLYAYVEPSVLKPGWDRDRVLQGVKDRNAPCFGGSCPEIYREPAFAARGWSLPDPLPVAAELGRTSLMFQVDHTLDLDDMAYVADHVEAVMVEATES